MPNVLLEHRLLVTPVLHYAAEYCTVFLLYKSCRVDNGVFFGTWQNETRLAVFQIQESFNIVQ